MEFANTRVQLELVIIQRTRKEFILFSVIILIEGN